MDWTCKLSPRGDRRGRAVRVALVAVGMGALAIVSGCNRTEVSEDASMPLVPQRLDRAWTSLRLGEFDAAADGFRGVLNTIEKFDKLSAHLASPSQEMETRWRLNAYYGLALVDSLGYHGQRGAEMNDCFGRVIAGDPTPNHELAAWAAEAQVRDAQIPNGSDAANPPSVLIPLYQKVIDTYPRSAAAEEAYVNQQALVLQALTPDAAHQVISGVTTYLASHPTTRFKSSLLDLVGNAWKVLNQPEAAFPYSQDAFLAQENDPSNPNSTRSGALYSLGLAAMYDVGDFPAARHYFEAFLREFPTDQKAYVVKLQLRKMDDKEAEFRASAAVPATMPATTPAAMSASGGRQ